MKGFLVLKRENLRKVVDIGSIINVKINENKLFYIFEPEKLSG